MSEYNDFVNSVVKPKNKTQPRNEYSEFVDSVLSPQKPKISMEREKTPMDILKPRITPRTPSVTTTDNVYEPSILEQPKPKGLGSFEPVSAITSYAKEKPAPKDSLLKSIVKRIALNAERTMESREAMRESFASGATLGLTDYLPRSQESIERKEYLKEKYPADVIVGELGGYAIPGAGFSKVGLKLAGKTGLKSLGKAVAGETAAGVMMGGTEGVIKQDRPLGRALEYGAFGGGATAGLGYGGRYLSKHLKNRNIDKAMDIYRTKGLTGSTVSPTPLPKATTIAPQISRADTPSVSSVREYRPPQVKIEAPEFKPTKIAPQFKGIDDNTLGILPESVRRNITQQDPAFKFSSPELEDVYKSSKGIPELTQVEKIKDKIKSISEQFTRPISTLPYTRETSLIYKDLLRLPKIKSITGDDTIRILDDITRDLDKNTFDKFSRKVLLDDFAEEVSLGNKLPNKFTSTDVERELGRLNKELTPDIKGAIDKRNKYWDVVKNEYVNTLKDVGVDLSDKFNRKNYFRHQVLEQMNLNATQGVGHKLKTPPKRGFSMERSGEYQGNINTDYLQAEYEVLAQMKHDTEIAKIIKNVKDNYDISSNLSSEANKLGKNIDEVIPDGYSKWQPVEGNMFYMANTIPEKVANELIEGISQQANITKDDLSKVLAIGGKKKEYIIPSDLATTLNNMQKVKPTNAISSIAKNAQSKWKQWVLTGNPKSVFKYNIRNFSGDLDPIITGNPSTLKKIPKSSTELFSAMKSGNFTDDLKDFYDRGGFQSTIYAQEISDVSKLEPFSKFQDVKFKDYLKGPFKHYGKITRNLTDYREMVGRYAAYLDYLEQLNKGNGVPRNYGASKKDLIDGLKDNRDKAFKLSNDLLGAYDTVSEAGQTIRSQLIPFYSWLEVNMKRYNQFFKNALDDPKTSNQITKTLGLGAKTIAKGGYKLSKLAVKAAALTGALSVWNNLQYPELENTLPEDVRRRPHIILGKDEKTGETLYFSRLGSLNDYLEWFGMGTITQDVKDILDGRKTIQEQAVDMIKSPINKIAGGITPLYKTPAELISGKSLYPDVTKPGNIRDKGQYLARSFNLKEEYDKVFGRPSLPYKDTLQKALLYKSDPKQSSYYKILDLKRKYEKKKGDTGTGFYQSDRSQALYNYKLSLKYNDEKSAKKYYDLYIKLGGKDKNISRSLKTMHPLYGLNKKEILDFKDTLTTAELRQLEMAEKYYNEVVSRK